MLDYTNRKGNKIWCRSAFDVGLDGQWRGQLPETCGCYPRECDREPLNPPEFSGRGEYTGLGSGAGRCNSQCGWSGNTWPHAFCEGMLGSPAESFTPVLMELD